jgi:hypothetical protein
VTGEGSREGVERIVKVQDSEESGRKEKATVIERTPPRH